MSKLEDIKALKIRIADGVMGSNFLIFKWEDNSFLAYQYAREIAKKKNLQIVYVDDFNDITSTINDMFSFTTTEDAFKIYSCDTFECSQDINLTKLQNVLVICHKTSIDAPYVYEFPKLEAWQIQAYMKTQCQGLNQSDIEWLYNITTPLSKNNENVYRLDNEMYKIGCFPKDQQKSIFTELVDSGGYSDLSPLTIFNFTNAILKKDIYTIKNVLREIDSIDVEGLVTILHKNFKQIIDIQIGRSTCESMGLSFKQYKAIEYNCGKYTSQDLIKIFKFITSIDFKLKSGLLEMSNSSLIDYIVCSIMS